MTHHKMTPRFLLVHTPTTPGENLKTIRDEVTAILEILAGAEQIHMHPTILQTVIREHAERIQECANDLSMEVLL